MKETNTKRPKLSKFKVMHTGKLCLSFNVPGCKPLLFAVQGVTEDERLFCKPVR